MSNTRAAARGGALGFVVSLVAPGIGHGVIGHAGRGTAWLGALLATWCLSAVVAVWWMPALLAGVVVSALLALGCAVDAARTPRAKIHAAGWVVLGVLVFVVFVVAPVGLSGFLRAFVVEAFKIPSGSMCPGLGVGAHVFVDKTAYRSRGPERGDVLVHMADTGGGGGRAAFIRRVTGVAGDEVHVSRGRVTVGGKAAPVRALGTRGCDDQELFEEELGTVHTVALGELAPEAKVFIVPNGHLFLMGDNRDNSHDSRATGPVEASSVIGRATTVWIDSTGLTWRQIR